MTDKLDDKALSHLTESEREILAEDDQLLEDALVPDAGMNVHGAPRGAEPEAEAVAPARAPRAADEDELRNDPTPILDASIPADLPPRLAALDEKKAQIVAAFDDGELTAREYSDALEAIADQRNDLTWERRKAELARETQERAVTQSWEREVERFMTTTAKDIAAKGEPALLAFDSYVKKVTGDPANARLSDRAQLAKAHRAFMADFGQLPAVRATPAPGSAADHARDAADFAALDRLAETNPMAYQKRIARMSDSEREEYGI